eukprot:scaffold364695_cov51-Prasinocladus_malaysianus.AAC.1
MSGWAVDRNTTRSAKAGLPGPAFPMLSIQDLWLRCFPADDGIQTWVREEAVAGSGCPLAPHRSEFRE